MWRIYSTVHQTGFNLDGAFDNREAVRLKTTARKLLNGVAVAAGGDRGANCFIGNVRYFEENALRQEVANVIGSKRESAFRGTAGHADGLLFKRDSFAHENEPRLPPLRVSFHLGASCCLQVIALAIIDASCRRYISFIAS